MSVVELLNHLRTRDVRVWADGESLRYNAPAGCLTDALKDAMRANKAAILAYLRDLDGQEHTSDYIPMHDGVRLAVDLFRPKRDGRPVARPLPVVWCLERYQRSVAQGDVVRTKLDTRPWLRHLVNHDYVVAVVDARGSGASTGSRGAEFGEAEIRDGHTVTEWLAAQSWCSGRVGMFGDSYLAIVQLLLAGTAPPHLTAVFAEMPLFDLYDFLYPGGVFRHDFAAGWSARVRELDTQPGVAAVAGHSEVVASVLDEHRANVNVFAQARAMPYRDSADPDGVQSYLCRSPSAALPAVAASGVPVYLLSGWHDMWTRDALLWYANLPQPRKLVIGTFHHTDRTGVDLTTEHLRWYDHWLKGIDNGVMAEPPIRYATVNADESGWRTATDWPPPARAQRYFLAPAGHQAHESVNDGRLDVAAPAVDNADEYRVDYACTTGRASRWTNGYGGPFGYPSTPSDTARSLTYTTAPLRQPTELTGHPVARLFVSSTHDDGDFFVYLEDVDPDGAVGYVSEGVLRASHRACAPAPYSNFGLPHHPGTERERLPLSGVVELVIDLHPISYVFRAGHSLRLRMTCADADNAETPVVVPAPVVRVHHGAAYPSGLEIPIAGPTYRSVEND